MTAPGVGEVRTLKKTCAACPSQWEGTMEDGRSFYARYRWGRLTWGFGPSVNAAVDASIQCKGISLGKPLAGDMGTLEMMRTLGLIFAAGRLGENP